MTILEVQTRSYTFMAIGKTEEEARAELWAAWKRHLKQCKMTLGESCYRSIEDMEDDICTTTIDTLPVCLRDWEAI
jgi:hypothetical protein